jgi:hypothetical protein
VINLAARKREDIYKSTRAIYFLGTPHQGSDMAAYGGFAKLMTSALGFSTRGTNLRDLKQRGEVFSRIHNHFMEAWQESCPHFELRTFEEAKGLTGFAFFGLDKKVSHDDLSPRVAPLTHEICIGCPKLFFELTWDGRSYIDKRKPHVHLSDYKRT